MPSLWLNSLYCLDLSVSFFCYLPLLLPVSLSLSLSLCCYLLLIKCSIIMTFTVVVVVVAAWDSLALCTSIDYSDWRFRNSHTNAFQSQKTIPVFNWNSQRRPRSATGSTHSAARLQCYQSLYLRLCLCLCQQPASLPSCHLEAADARYKLSINFIRERRRASARLSRPESKRIRATVALIQTTREGEEERAQRDRKW